MLSNTSILSCVELALYFIISPLALFIAYRHGRHGTLGYLYLNLSIGIRIAADIAQLVDDKKDATTPSLATTVLSSIGISPLLLAMSGILHELHHYLAHASAATAAGKKSRWPVFIQIQMHALCSIGMILLIIGSIHLMDATSASEANSANKLRSAGAVLLFVTWLGLMQYIACIFFRYHRAHQKSPRSTLGLRNWVLVALLFGGAKMVYVVVYTFDHANTAINPITGSFAIKVVLVVGVQLSAVVAMTIGGWVSLNIVREHSA